MEPVCALASMNAAISAVRYRRRRRLRLRLRSNAALSFVLRIMCVVQAAVRSRVRPAAAAALAQRVHSAVVTEVVV